MIKKTEKTFIEKILDSVEGEINFSEFDTIYVGFSGGADSAALLVVLEILSGKYGFDLVAVHFEHGLRGQESIDDAAWCKDFCKNRGIKYMEFSLNICRPPATDHRPLTSDHRPPTSGTEAHARELRLEKWQEIVNSEKEAVALGHHEDDKIENLILRLIRGSNSSGLTSLRHSTMFNGVNIIRPLLDVSRHDIEEFLLHNNIRDWRVDSTNKESNHRRNIIRNEILPKLYESIPESKVGFCRAVKALKDDAYYIEQESFAAYTNLVKTNFETLASDALIKMHTAIRARVLRYWLTDLLGFDFIPNHDFLERIDSELRNESNERILMPLHRDSFLQLDKGMLSIFKDVKPDLKSCVWRWKTDSKIQIGNYSIEAKIIKKLPDRIKGPATVYFDSSMLPEELHINFWKRGDKFIPFAADHAVKVKRVFKNEKISLEARSQIPLLCMPDDSIIWIAGLKRSNYASVKSSTKEIASFFVH